MKIALKLALAAMLLPAAWAAAQAEGPARGASPQASQPATAQPATAAVKQAPRAHSRAEWKAYRSAVAQTDPAKLETQAVDFAQKFPGSQLRAFLFQRAMALYERKHNSAKSLQMARAVLKYEPENPVALVTAAQILANGARESDLDRDGRLDEAHADALSALRNAEKIQDTPGLGAEQRDRLTAQLIGAAHEALGTVAFKRRDFATALKEYYIAAAEEKNHPNPVVWLRMSVAFERTGNLPMASDAADKAIHASTPGTRVRKLAEKQKARLGQKTAAPPAKRNAAPPAASSQGGGRVRF